MVNRSQNDNSRPLIHHISVQYLNLPQIFGTMQLQTIKALRDGKIPRSMLRNAFQKGLINQVFIDEVAEYLNV